MLNGVILQYPALKRVLLALYQLICDTGPLTTWTYEGSKSWIAIKAIRPAV